MDVDLPIQNPINLQHAAQVLKTQQRYLPQTVMKKHKEKEKEREAAISRR